MISIPTDPNLIFEILTQQRPSHWITLPINNYDGSIVSALKGDYGFEGFPIFDKSQRAQAVAKYTEIVKTIHPEVAL